jgi:hypothetical protein
MHQHHGIDSGIKRQHMHPNGLALTDACDLADLSSAGLLQDVLHRDRGARRSILLVNMMPFHDLRGVADF